MQSWCSVCLAYTRAVNIWRVCMQMGDFGSHFVMRLLQRAGLAAGICVFGIGGAMVGGIAGAMKGQTTETGFCRGAAIGLISGAIVALEVLDSIIHGHVLSKVALFGSIVNGKAFREWVSPAVLKAYLWQVSMVEDAANEVRGIYDVDETRRLTPEIISELPVVAFGCDQTQIQTSQGYAISCTICLQDLLTGEKARVLRRCEHMFHVQCIDEWLVRNASCPVCRNQVD